MAKIVRQATHVNKIRVYSEDTRQFTSNLSYLK
jgi:hypothetical protein